MHNKYYILIIIFLISCREGVEYRVQSEYLTLPITARPIDSFSLDEPIGLYLLNEGNMGSNKAMIDYVDFSKGCYVQSLYTEQNPSVVKELGDVGNDIQIYGNRLYAVINGSHKVEVMDARTCVRIGQIDIPNARYIKFHKDYAYISSYSNPIGMNPNAQLGSIYEIDTSTLQINRTVAVGFQPEEMEIAEGYIYCANSGGYMKPDYDNTVSIVELSNLRQINKIPVAVNLHHILKDRYNKLWVSARGDYEQTPSCVCVLEQIGNKNDYTVTDTLPIPCTKMALHGDSLYYFSVSWSETKGQNDINYGILDVRTKKIISDGFITDGSESDIETPYGLAINPYNGDIYVTDAKNYVSSGKLHCYNKYGKLKWLVWTRDIPAHIVFVYKDNKKIYVGD